MKNLGILILTVLLFAACNPKKVSVYGKVKGLKSGEIILLKQVPGQDDLVELSKTEVDEDGDFKISTENVVLPARLWIEFPNGYRVSGIIDTKNKTFVKAVKDHYDQAEVLGSGIETQYNGVKKLIKEKYVDPMVSTNKAIKKINAKKKISKNHKVMLGVYELRIQKYKKYRANYARKLIEKNPGQDLSMFLMYDELKDSIELKKKLLPQLMVGNKECNIYKILEYEASHN